MNLVEIFSSVQGEGVHVGESTLFVRFGECDLRCRWCDSPGTWQPAKTCDVETLRGSGTGHTLENPVSIEAVTRAAADLDLAAHRFVSLTGGEPLLQPDAVVSVARALSGRGPGIHLETHGLAVGALEQVIECIDVVSMDWKLRSDVRRASDPRGAQGEEFHAAHAKFLEVARRAPEVSVKVVVTPDTQDDEIDRMRTHIAAQDSGIPVIVQPVTPFGPVRKTPSAERVLALADRLAGELRDVRVIPQTHKFYGVR